MSCQEVKKLLICPSEIKNTEPPMEFLVQLTQSLAVIFPMLTTRKNLNK